jgi:hypothetical protein
MDGQKKEKSLFKKKNTNGGIRTVAQAAGSPVHNHYSTGLQ